MSSLIMWNLGNNEPVVEDPDRARITAEAVRTDDADIQPVAPPDFNEVETDSSSELVGLAPREKASYYEPSQKYTPAVIQTATENHNAIIDNQVATSGTAAMRESAGIQGHGTMPITIGIEPEIREGSRFGNTYFERTPINANQGAGDYMTPTQTDNWAQSVLNSRANDASRDAYVSSAYNSFLSSITS